MTLELVRLDHVNVRTANLAAMTEWYCARLGMRTGPRPDFDFPGAWLYVGDAAVVHLVGVDAIGAQSDLSLEHFALSARGLGALIERLEAAGERHMLRRVPGFPILQVNVWDPDGNHLHIDFDSAEADTLGL